MQISEISEERGFEGFAAVVSAEKRVASNGRGYVDLVLTDRSGYTDAKLWQDVDAPPAGCVVFVKGVPDKYRGAVSLRVCEMREAVPEDGVNVEDFLPHSPEPVDRMKLCVLETVASFRNDALRDIVSEMIAMAGPSVWTRPAALQMHHAEIGGLMHHVCSMLECAKCIAGVYPFLDRDLLLAGVVVHDLAKTREMNLNGLGLVSDYSADGMLTGHITLGVCAVAEASARTGHGGCEEEMLLRHMVLSHHEKPEFGSPVPPRFPEAHVLSAIDSLDAVMFEMEDVLKNTAPGTMSGRANALRRELYRRQGIAGAAQQPSAPPQNDASEEDSGICR